MLRNAAVKRRIERLAWLLDAGIRLPGGFRIGLDGIIGLIPGIGDLVGAVLSSYIVVEAARLKVPLRIRARMVLNILIELVVGVLPIAGDLFDFAFKANLRNVGLLNAYLSKGE
ncbi:DUF4112 domain-containing protein [Oceanisphaera sp. DM8]|uniref:DUF4112 domain-containing protein n=1 Tax=Oceanisphaera pacifica TaxID=2818389 RepID=A0ABS3NFP1_9GAMM|nr:DUF4112 domain-containing protein [Oceanisphaera pacifica]MBO1519106.1 DUF4112 domain-containing protein [Oceanisphaera pacifica]